MKISKEDEIEMLVAGATVPFTDDYLTLEQKSVNAMCKIFEIVKIYNEGWVYMKNPKDYGYVPYVQRNNDGRLVVAYYAHGLSRLLWPVGLHFKTSDLAIKAAKDFWEIYCDFWMLEDRRQATGS